MMLIYSIICKYVFFESGLEAEKQRVYYVASLLFCVIFMFVFDDTVAGYTMEFLVGLNVVLARKSISLVWMSAETGEGYKNERGREKAGGRIAGSDGAST